MKHSFDCTRGSEWRVWDLHIHSPASFHWEGERFGGNEAQNIALLDDMIAALNEAEPCAYGLMDYWHFDGWFRLKKRLGEAGAPNLNKAVFPGIELRLAAPIEGRLNAHVLFSNEINDQYLKDFLSTLRLELINKPLSDNALIEYARNANADKLRSHGFDHSLVATDDDMALRVGYMIAEINCDSYKRAIRSVPDNMALGFMPFSTNDGLDSVKWNEHYAYALGLFETSPIFETRKSELWAAFVGIKTAENEKFFSSFQTALRGVPRLAVSGSDAHCFRSQVKGTNKRGYGDFPSNKTTWIKADPTWRGLQQSLKEPANRSHIGTLPPKLDQFYKNKTFYIDRLVVRKVNTSIEDPWLDGCEVCFNPDLVAIIGNKGSGKSAIADIIAVLGGSQQSSHFSFLKRDRFRGKSGDPARQFEGTLSWFAGDNGTALLSENPSPDKVELVKYIPQGRFEALCNEHVSGRSDAFEYELRQVIFSHVEPSVRLDALSFDQLLEKQEAGLREKVLELRKKIRSINDQIVKAEDQMHPSLKKNLEEQVRLKDAQLQQHWLAKPVDVAPPSEVPTEAQAVANGRLGEIADELTAISQTKSEDQLSLQKNAADLRSLTAIKDGLATLQRHYQDFVELTRNAFKSVNLSHNDVLTFAVNEKLLDEKSVSLNAAQEAKAQSMANLHASAKELAEERLKLTAELNEPQQLYQKYLADLQTWQTQLAAIEGTETEPETKKGLLARLAQVAEIPQVLDKRKADRAALVKEVYQTLDDQKKNRASLFQPLQDLIERNHLIRQEYRLHFQSNLQASLEKLTSSLFDQIKQNIGEIRGEDESIGAVRKRIDLHAFDSDEDAVAFTEDLVSLVYESAQLSAASIPGIRSLMRKEKQPQAVYDSIYCLEYLEPKYTLIFQDTPIEQLSPGQRGALLLIFYLLVDKGRNPIILDQPEENLDNETIVSLLVPVLREAKKNRQIVMVTHNPNLAVVCDAEQIVHATFDRKDGLRISYQSGSIEDGTVNKAVVDILEGTKRAFDNRRGKYH